MTQASQTPTPQPGPDAERDVRERVWDAICDDDPCLECPQCNGQIELIGDGMPVCDMCNKEWSVDDVAQRNRL